MKKRVFLLTLAAAGMAAIAVACGGDSSSKGTPAGGPQLSGQATSAPVTAGPNDVLALKKTPSTFAADDAAWKDAKATTVKTAQIKGSASTEGKDVKVQALYSDTDVWFRFEWADANKTLVGNWTFDGTKWTNEAGQQDRLALLFPITPIADFQTKGCFAVCHNPAADPVKQWYMITPASGNLADLWQWTAKISNGMNEMNDGTLTSILTSPTALGSPIVADPYTGGGSFNNRNADNSGPLFMQNTTIKPTMGSDYLVLQEAVLLDPKVIKAGDKVPNVVVAPYQGDRGDIDAKGSWSNNTWTVIAHRKLDTGNADDVKLTVGGSFPFGLAAFNALGDVDHTVTETAYNLLLK